MERKRKRKTRQSNLPGFCLFPEGKCFGAFVVAAGKKSLNLYGNWVGGVWENVGAFDGYGVSWLNVLE